MPSNNPVSAYLKIDKRIMALEADIYKIFSSEKTIENPFT